jgi:hypothetical protein
MMIFFQLPGLFGRKMLTINCFLKDDENHTTLMNNSSIPRKLIRFCFRILHLIGTLIGMLCLTQGFILF